MAFNPATYTRKIELLDSDASTVVAILSEKGNSSSLECVEDATFTLLRQGGCGQGNFRIAKDFQYDTIEMGHFIRCSHNDGGDPWYLGRIEEIVKTSPSGIELSTYGPITLLHDTPVGGQGPWDLRGPHLFAATDVYEKDLDRDLQSWDVVSDFYDFVNTLFTIYIAPTGISEDTIDSISNPVDFLSMVFRGEESVSEALRMAAMAAYGASYGIKGNNGFFFFQQPTATQATFQEGVDLQSLRVSIDRSLMFNRVVLVGDWVYGTIGDDPEVKTMRYVATDYDASSIATWGQRPVHLYLPYIRSNADASRFLTQFFNKYSGPRTRYTITTQPDSTLLTPWGGPITIKDRDGTTLVTDNFDEVKVYFNEAPYFEVTTGEEDLQYQEPPESERWPLELGGGGDGVPSDDFPSVSVSDVSLSTGACSYTMVSISGTDAMTCTDTDYPGPDPEWKEVVTAVRCSDDSIVYDTIEIFVYWRNV